MIDGSVFSKRVAIGIGEDAVLATVTVTAAEVLVLLEKSPATPTSSEALAETVIGPETVAPALGAVMATVGGAVSEMATPVTSKASKTTRMSEDEAFFVAVFSIATVCGP